MEKFIQNLIDGYENPALITDASEKKILYTNKVAREVLSIEPGNGHCLEELFTPHSVVRSSVIWERMNQYYRIHEEKLNLNDREFIKVTLNPVALEQNFDFFELQREMARLLVHRLHSPLNGISGYAELLAEQGVSEKQREYLDEIEEGLKDIKGILSEIHDLAKEPTVQVTTFEIREFIDSILKDLPADQRRRVNVIFPDEARKLESDFVLLQHIVTELLQNALQHSEDPEGPVSVAFEEQSIRVTNYGTPIPDDYVRKMFYPFFSNKARGIGLGLPTCVTYAREMGYSVLLTGNSSQEGITFEVRMREH